MAEAGSSPRADENADIDVDEELLALQARLKEMEEEKTALESSAPAEASKTADGDEEMGEGGGDDEPAAVDARSIYIGNVDYGATPEEIQAHFQACGTINRVTILCDKFTGHPKGYAYVEFAEPSIVQNAVVLNESSFRGRIITVREKRTNVPGMNMTNRGRGRGRGRGRPFRARGRGRGRGW